MLRLIEKLRTESRDELADELEALIAIVPEDAVEPVAGQGLTLSLRTALPPPHEDIEVALDVTIPDSYPSVDPPRISLPATTRYIGPFGVEDNDPLRALLSALVGPGDKVIVRWDPGEPILWDLLEAAKEELGRWYSIRADEKLAQDLQRQDERAPVDVDSLPAAGPSESIPVPTPAPMLPDGVRIFSSEPIVDRKSVFVGHAAKLDDPAHVGAILNHLLSDRKIARATHNIVAWRCRMNGSLHQDNDDDGETAAGSRMAHLLEILGVENVFVCVTRWYGGTQLGADRFKHINQATRDALQLGGFLPTDKQSKSSSKKR